MTTIDAAQAGIGRWMMAQAERRARVRTRRMKRPGARALQALMQIIGMGWLDYAAWDWSRTAGYVAIGISFMLVGAMITGDGGERG